VLIRPCLRLGSLSAITSLRCPRVAATLSFTPDVAEHFGTRQGDLRDPDPSKE